MSINYDYLPANNFEERKISSLSPAFLNLINLTITSPESILSSKASVSLPSTSSSSLPPSTQQVEYAYSTRDPLYIVIPLTLVYSIIFLTGVLGNFITCIVISRNKSMHTATNYYLFSLAVSDLLLLVSGELNFIVYICHIS